MIMLNNRLLLITLIITLTGCAAPALIIGGAAGGAVTAADRRTGSALADDQTIELKIGKTIYTDPELKQQVHINITSYNGVVLLSGEAPNATLRARAATIASNVEKVKVVHNELITGSNSTLKSRSNDTWITTKIKGNFVNASELSALNIKVVTENQSVFLMGIVSREESRVAGVVASRTSGVKEVVKLFEIND